MGWVCKNFEKVFSLKMRIFQIFVLPLYSDLGISWQEIRRLAKQTLLFYS